MAVEPVGVLVDIGLQVHYRMMCSSQPDLEHHDGSVHLFEVFPFLSRFLPDKFGEILLHAPVTTPAVCFHLSVPMDMVFFIKPPRLALKAVPTTLPHHLEIPFPTRSIPTSMIFSLIPAQCLIVLVTVYNLTYII